MEPKKVIQALEDPSWIEAMQEELLQFQLQKVWTLVNLPNGKRAIGTKWVFINKKGMREACLVKTKARQVAQMSSMGELTFFLGLQVQQKKDGIFISQDKYVADILKKFDFATVKTASTPMEPNKELIKDEEADSVDVHLYRSMIGSLMYLTASRPDIMFAVCACARFQVTPKMSHLHAVKRIFRSLKGQPKLGLWYLRDSPFDLEAFSNSDYAGASLDRKSTTGGCQFLGKRLISWQCKKQTIVANSTTEAEYVAAANCMRDRHRPAWNCQPAGLKPTKGLFSFLHRLKSESEDNHDLLNEDEKVLGLRSVPYASILSLDSKSIIIALGSSPPHINGLGDVMPSNKSSIKMLCDNEHAKAIANDPRILKGARHFQRKYHYICEVNQECEIVLKKLHTDENIANPFTKPMPFNKHYEHAMAIGIVPASSLM
ncbi:uncharacterized mitochondrial protein-like protein [Tanacetum coccineum]